MTTTLRKSAYGTRRIARRWDRASRRWRCRREQRTRRSPFLRYPAVVSTGSSLRRPWQGPSARHRLWRLLPEQELNAAAVVGLASRQSRRPRQVRSGERMPRTSAWHSRKRRKASRFWTVFSSPSPSPRSANQGVIPIRINVAITTLPMRSFFQL